MKSPLISTTKKLSFAVLAVWLTALYTGSAATVLFVGSNTGSGNDDWSTTTNFLNVASPFAATTPANNAANFNFNTQASAPGIVTVNVDGGYGVPGAGTPQAWGMIFGQTNGYQTVLIQPGLVLSMMAANATEGGGGFCVCPAGTNSGGNTSGNTVAGPYTNYTTIIGPNATLYVDGNLRVEGAEANGPTNHYTILDLSQLDTFIQTNTSSSATGDFYVAGGGAQRSQALLYLAKTNYITPNSSIQIGYTGNYSNSLPIGVYLGRTNYMAPASTVTFALGYVGCANAFMQFNPAFLGGANPPTAYLAGNGGALMNQVFLGDPANGKVSGMATADFTGGKVTWLANNFQMGVSAAAGINGTGTLTFDNGTVSANKFIVGYQQSSFSTNGGYGIGVINVNTNATYGAGATLVAVSSLTLGQITGMANPATAGTININGGALNASSIVTAGGVGTVNMTNATWAVALPTAGGTNMAVTAFAAGGATNIINLTSITPLLGSDLPVRFHLIASANIVGASTLGLGTLPASYDGSHPYAGYLDTTSSVGYVDFVLTSGPATARILTWSGTNAAGNPDGDWDVGITADWLTNGVGTIYNQFDLANFHDVAAPAATNINLTTTLTPLSVTVSNAASLYTLSGSGSLSGATGLLKQGSGTLILDNSTPNTFTGGVMVSGGILQVGNNDGNGNLPSGPVTNNAILAFDRLDSVVLNDVISGAGAVVVAGGGALQLAAVNTFTGSAVATNNSTLQGGTPGSFGGGTNPVIIASGSTLDPEGAIISKGVTVSGSGVGGEGAIINSGGTIPDSGGGLTPTLTLAGNTTLSFPTRWDLGSSTGATLSTGGNPYTLTLNGSGYFEWRDVRADAALSNIYVIGGTLGYAGSSTAGSPLASLVVSSGAGVTFYNDDGFNATLNKQLVVNDGATVQNGGGATTITGPVVLTNSSGSQYCIFNVGGTSLTLTNSLSGNGILYTEGGSSPLILNGNSPAFTGGVDLTAGSLVINGTLGSGVTNQANTTLSGNGTVNGVVDAGGALFPGGANVAGTFTVNGLVMETGAALTMDLGNSPVVGGGVNDLIQDNGDLTVNNNTVYINPIGASLGAGTYTLINYTGNLNGAFAGIAPISATRYSMTLTNITTTSPKQIAVIVSGGPSSLVWNDASGDGQWNVQGSQNWSNQTSGVSPDYFFTKDSVLFDDSILTASTPVTNVVISGGQAVSPTFITNNSTVNYSINGPGKISGATTLVKEGPSTLTINNTNDFSGPVTVMGGTVVVGTATALGAPTGTVTLTNGGTLDLDGNYLVSKSFVVSGAGVGGNGAIVNNGGSVYDNPGAVTNVLLTSDTSFGGPNRWDLGSATGATLSTGGKPFSLTYTNANSSTYWEWDDVAVDTNLTNINLMAGQLGVKGMTSLGNSNGTVTIYPGAQLTFWGGSNYTKHYDVKNTGTLLVRQTGPTFNLSLTLEDGAIFSSIDNVKQITGPVSLTGLAVAEIGSAACTFSNVISGPGGLVISNLDANDLVLAGANTYTGPTLLSGSGMNLELLGNGSISNSDEIYLAGGSSLIASTRSDGTLTLAGGQTLGGSGAVTGNLVAGAGSAVAPGTNGIGTLTVSGTANLQGATLLGLGAGSNNMLSASSINYGGTLDLSFAPGSLATNSSFVLFQATTYSGGFASLNPATPGAGLQWNTNLLNSTGTLEVVGAASAPTPATFGSYTVSGTSLTFTGSGGTPNGAYRVFSASDLTVPAADWTQVGGGTFDSNGNFTFSTTISPSNAAEFYVLREP